MCHNTSIPHPAGQQTWRMNISIVSTDYTLYRLYDSQST